MYATDDALPEWPAPERNKGPILEVLRRVLPARGEVLEIASGTGQHALHFARALPALTFQPSDVDEDNLHVVAERVRRAALGNLRAPLKLDARSDHWPITRADAIYAANMVHIAPWEAALGLFRGAGRLLPKDGVLVTYGPYMVDGAHTSASNADFDASLKSRDPSWGVRDIAALRTVASEHDLELRENVVMPANNLTLVWQKRD